MPLNHSREAPNPAQVTIVSADMRTWVAPEPADILVSELLGSFGDNELSPECLDGAQRFLAPGVGALVDVQKADWLCRSACKQPFYM
jgi:hypothetical protein